MDPKENQHLYSPKTPIKIRPPIYLSEGLRFITSEQKPQKQDLLDSILHFGLQQHLLFLSNEKQDISNNQEISVSQHSIDSDDSASDPQQPQEENSQTVKKLCGTKFTIKDTQIETTAKINKKGCNCENSKCLKNYCICYKSGGICSQECQCIDCQNTKITSQHLKNYKVALEFQSNSKFKGCNCKTKCLKKYCICHSHGRKCSELCKCQDCHNTEDKENDDFEEEKGVRLNFTTRKKIKVSEFDCELNIISKG